MQNINQNIAELKITEPPLRGRHYEHIKNTTTALAKHISLHRAQALGTTSLKKEKWHAGDRQTALKAANLQAWRAQAEADEVFRKVKNVYEFAEPLLKASLKHNYGVDVDVKSTYLRLYFPKQTPWYVIDTLPSHASRTVSLLDAALHNFATSETFTADSGFISKPDANGHFDVLPVKAKMSIEQFKTLCRELDIGGQYNQYLRAFLLAEEPVSQGFLELKATASHKATLEAAAHLALMKKDIGTDAFNVVLGMIEGQTGLTLDGKLMQCSRLSMLDASLTGIVLFTAARQSAGTDKLIAYVPHDPEHPLREYASALEFVQELTRQLRENQAIPSSQGNYWQFFSQFIDQSQRGHFFAGLGQRLSTVKWHEKDRLDPGPTWRETPVDNPRLEFRVTPIEQDLWQHLYQTKLNKIINDAEEIALSTASTDRAARWAWWDNFRKMLSDIFNAALLVLTPFVPGLGELMLAYTAYQLASEVVEGIVDLAEGQWVELAEHVVGVVTDVLQLAAFGVGGAIGAGFRLKLSPFVEGLQPVRLPDGSATLWNPDLGPYAHKDLRLPDASRPDALGLHPHEGKEILALDGQHFEVRHDPQIAQHRIQHPTRAQAYRPIARHNGQGAWVHEAETPQGWEGPTLMRRLGHSVDRYTAAELENIRRLSGVEESALRRMYVENTAPPPLLEDTLTRLRIYADSQGIGERIRRGQPLDPASHWFERLVPDLPGWPADKALRVYEQADLGGPYRHYGNPDAAAQTLGISAADLMAGELPQRLADFLDEADMTALLGRPYPANQRVQALRNRMADAAQARQTDIFNYQYGFETRAGDAQAQLLQRQFPQLPSRVAQALVGDATPAEFRAMTEQQRIPLRLKDHARESAFELRAARAREGFLEPELHTPDTERLALNVLKLHTDTYEHLRIEVRDGSHDGPLRCSAGSNDAPHVRILLRDDQGRYEVWEPSHNKRREAGDFYQALLQAMPENKRIKLGYRTTQGALFKQWVMVMTEPPAERRTLLAQPPIRRVVPRETELLLRGKMLSKGAQTVEEKIRNLYPHFDDGQVDAFSRSLHAQGDPHLQIETLESELKRLKNTLEDWRQRYLSGFDPDEPSGNLPSPYMDFRRNGGQFVADRLLECFERKAEVFNERGHSLEGGYALDLSAEFFPHDLERWWRELPDLKPYLQQITTLNLDGTRFSQGSSKLLSDLRHIRRFSARNCELSSLPEGVGAMRLLETLRLSDNRIRLTPSAHEQLRNLTRMETLRLDNNPLGALPDIGRMPRLKVLSLFNTGVNAWPVGLFNKPRPKGFFLDLQANPVTSIPQVAQGSDKAFVIARTRVDARRLSDLNRQTYEGYRESAGLTPVLNYPPAMQASARALLSRWPAPDDTYKLADSPGVGAYREEAWYDLVAEPDSEGFFRVLTGLTQSADYLQAGAARQQLSDRVWRMVDAANLDTPLREALFLMSTNPEGCEDAGAQLFNNMGLKVLASEAELFSTSAAERERKMVTLAKASARLEQVTQIARDDIKARDGRPDEVEVHLAYETGLAKRLELPWQSEAMKFRAVAGVTEETIDAAYDQIIDHEDGDGLINQMIAQPLWEQYLSRTYPGELARNTLAHQQKLDLVIDLQSAQQAWADAPGLSATEIFRRKQNLMSLATTLGIDPDRVFTGQPMTDETNARLQEDIANQRLELARRLTREALARAVGPEA